MSSKVFKFGSYTFIEETGEIIIEENSVTKLIGQLPPQPSKLLKLLIEHHPNLVSHQQIKETIWPDVTVDYDRSLHFCIRQIRAGLKENASAPRFIETIPKKGYRWMVPTVDEGKTPIPISFSDSSTKSESPSTKHFSRLKLPQVAILLSLILLLALILSNNLDTESTSIASSMRLGIMPLQPTDTANSFMYNDLALVLLDKLNKLPVNLDVVGPTTTEKHPSTSLTALSESLALDIIINARFSQQNDTSKILAEIIRSSDGAHVWVNYYNQFTSTILIADEIVAGLQSKLLQAQ